MSEISSILSKLKETRESEVLNSIEEAYKNISAAQKVWYDKSQFYCADGCGECCRNFEPDLMESEALYMAAWIMENQPEVAASIAKGKFPFPREKGCPLWDENNAYHCTIYGGRALICRLFGACGSHAKNGETVFKPCKFYPEDKLKSWKTPLTHRQYSQSEIESIFGVLPPVMSDLTEGVVSISNGNETKLIRDILPDAIRRLQWIISMSESK